MKYYAFYSVLMSTNIPLAEKLRPKNLDEVIGQEHLTGTNAPVRKMVEHDTLNSIIFWGPPGTGKTTLSEIISESSGRKFFKLSAVSYGVKEIYVLESLDYEIWRKLGGCSVERYNKRTSEPKFSLKDKACIYSYSGGDARKLINSVEIVLNQFIHGKKTKIENKDVLSVLQENMALYDKNGEQHYDIVSAFIKSIRGSDPNGAVYWLARMLTGGEDIKFIARRMLICASEDIGLANPNALVIANNCFQAINVYGPLARILLTGSFTTYFLQHNIGFNTVFSAGLVGLLPGSLLPKLRNSDLLKWPIAVYCGHSSG
ncbi:hypothetical protein FQR65_LT16150 [Abscondita terminalis]|nr:hypothetical protein FQR65_LT16150 [Abscondita terminalis]